MIAVENLLEIWPGPLPEFAPLMAQPLVEHCLGIPRLPDVIQARRSKGSPDSFAASLYETRRAEISEFLMGGVLARHRIVDRKALGRVLSDPSPVKGHDHLRILAIVDVEAWAPAF